MTPLKICQACDEHDRHDVGALDGGPPVTNRTDAPAVTGSAGQNVTTEPPLPNDLMQRLAHQDKAWIDTAMEVLRQACVDHETVTTDTVWPSLTWPTTKSGGRLIGKVVREALQRGWMIKTPMANGHLDCLDHVTLPRVHTVDGVRVHHKSPVLVYQSMLGECPSGPDPKDSCKPASAPRGLAR